MPHDLAPDTGVGVMEGRQAVHELGCQQPKPSPVNRHPRHPEPFCHLLVAGAGLDQLRYGQPHCSRRARSSAFSPPPSAYLMVPA
jgi:hypothetical protein